MQEMQVRVLLALRKEVHQASLSLLQLLRMSRNAVRKLKRSFLRALQTNWTLPTASVLPLPSPPLLYRHGPYIHYGLVGFQALRLGE
jgi:hypothetical protein